MNFVKGSHKNPIVPHEDNFDELNLLSRGQSRCRRGRQIQRRPRHWRDQPAPRLDDPWFGANTSHDRQIRVVMRFLSPHVKKPNNAPDYGVPMRGRCDTGNFTLCDAPKGLFHPDDLLLYEEIRTEQAKVMMAGAKGNAEMYA